MNNEDRDAMISRIANGVAALNISMARFEERLGTQQASIATLAESMALVVPRVSVLERNCESSQQFRTHRTTSRGVIIAAILGLTGTVVAAIIGYLAA